MEKTDFLKLFNECLQDGSINISAEHTDVYSRSDSWKTTNITIEIKIGDEPLVFHNYHGV